MLRLIEYFFDLFKVKPSKIKNISSAINCDGSRRYSYDPTKSYSRGKRLKEKCQGCISCQQ